MQSPSDLNKMDHDYLLHCFESVLPGFATIKHGFVDVHCPLERDEWRHHAAFRCWCCCCYYRRHSLDIHFSAVWLIFQIFINVAIGWNFVSFSTKTTNKPIECFNQFFFYFLEYQTWFYMYLCVCMCISVLFLLQFIFLCKIFFIGNETQVKTKKNDFTVINSRWEAWKLKCND